MSFTLGQNVCFPQLQLFGLPYKEDMRNQGTVLKIEEHLGNPLYTVRILESGALDIPLKYYAKQLRATDVPVTLSDKEQALLAESMG